MKKILIGSIVILATTAVVFSILLNTQNNTGLNKLDEAAVEESTIPDAKSGLLTRYFIDDAVKRGAVCNDGSPGVFYYSQGSGDGADKWIIHLKGGGSCLSLEDCANRWDTKRNFMTSNRYTENINGAGILSANAEKNTDFYNWNHVRINYCSSDTWKGNNVIALENGKTLYFKGRQILDSTLEDLQNEEIIPGSSLANATEVLFTGSSAGGYGATMNLDHVAETLSWAKVSGVNDSAVAATGIVGVFDESSITGSAPTPEEIFDFHGSLLDKTCLEKNVEEPWRCQGVLITAQYIESPFFVYNDQRDGLQVRRAGVDSPFNADEKAYIEKYAQGIKDIFEGVEFGFSTSVAKHTAIASSNVFTLKIDGYSYYDILTNWYFNRDGPKKLIAE